MSEKLETEAAAVGQDFTQIDAFVAQLKAKLSALAVDDPARPVAVLIMASTMAPSTEVLHFATVNVAMAGRIEGFAQALVTSRDMIIYCMHLDQMFGLGLTKLGELSMQHPQIREVVEAQRAQGPTVEPGPDGTRRVTDFVGTEMGLDAAMEIKPDARFRKH